MPLALEEFSRELAEFPSHKRRYVLNGIQFGFHVGWEPQRESLRFWASNMRSATDHPNVVDEYLRTELAAGRLAAPFIAPPLRSLHVSPFGVIPKNHQPGKWCLILDLSSPLGHSHSHPQLTMASLNINSLLAHIDDLRVFIDNSNIDILAINESKLDFSVDDDQVYLTGFDIIRKDRLHNGRSGGGVCIYLRSSLNFRICEDLLNDNLECILVEISNTRSKPFLVSTWYRPPNSPSILISFLTSKSYWIKLIPKITNFICLVT